MLQTDNNKILYVDDEVANLRAFESMFGFDYPVVTVLSAVEALELMQKEKIVVVIADQRMPEMTGIEFLEKVSHKYPHTIRMILTGYADLNSVTAAINNCGIYRYFNKPWQQQEVRLAIEKGLESYNLKEDRLKLLSQLQETNQQLELKVADRTKKLEDQNMELLKTKEILKKSNTVKDKVLSIIAHDMRTPLSGLIMYLDLLNDGQVNFSEKEHQDILRQLRVLVTDVNDFLENLLLWAISEMKSNKLVISDFGLQALLSQVERIYQPQLTTKNITIETILPKEDVKVRSDENRFRYILRNLVQNAIKFTSEGGKITLEIQVKNELVHLKVKDTGVGISSEKISIILDGQLPESAKGTSEELGSGIGLKVVRDYVKELKGKFEINSATGKGSEFYVTIPVRGHLHQYEY